MPSRLSSLLVRDGLVGVKRMEKAFQRQVIYGGSLDTILLEMGLVPEERLTQYLALASGLPPAARDEGHVIAPEATALVTREIAERHRACPVAIEGEAIRLLVCAPLEITELEDLADLLDRPLQPLITPEYRWHLAYASAYALDPPARFTTLARSLDVDTTTSPVGRPRSVIVEASDSTRRTDLNRAIEPIAADQPTTKMAALHEDLGRHKSGTLMGLRPARAATDTSGIIQPQRAPAQRTTAPGVGVSPHDGDAVVIDLPIDPQAEESQPNWLAPRAESQLVAVTLPKSVSAKLPSIKIPKRADTAPMSTAGRDTPLQIGRAREILATADDRDSVFLTLLRAARGRARWAGLLTVQGGAAIGRVALAEPGIDTQQVTSILIPLDSVSVFRSVVANQQPHIGPLVSGDPGIDAMLLRMGGPMPPSALVMPIVLRERVIALLIAHRSHSDIRIVDVTELLPLATVASDAIGRLIVKHKAAGYRVPVVAAGASGAPISEFESEVDTKRIVLGNRAESQGEWAVPEPGPENRPSMPAIEMSYTPEQFRSIDSVLDEIETAREGSAEDAIADAVERTSETLGSLVRRFPGKLRVDRFAVTGRPLRAAQYGGLLELVIRLGSVASELLIEKMSAPQRDIRFYATVCAAELRPRNAVFALVERLFDQDFGLRATAIEALSGYPIQDLAHALVRVRRAVHSTDSEVVAAATGAVVQLGDVEALSDLIGSVERNDRGGEHARRALTALTAQDFGPSERKWRKWHETAKRRHRIEWLIDGLSHREDAIRELAIGDLRRLTGEYFGYHHDLPKKERELAAARWLAWWKETGQRRFEARDDERQRPTAVLPARREP